MSSGLCARGKRHTYQSVSERAMAEKGENTRTKIVEAAETLILAQGYAGTSWSVFAGVDHRLVAHNIFLDGPVFRDGPSVDRRKHVRDMSAGFSVRVDGLRFSWTRIHRSAEFDTALGSGGKQRFDSLNLGYEF